MGASEELEYLKSLVSQLNEKIVALEKKDKSVAPAKTPAAQLRTILIGPPGAGMPSLHSCAKHNLTLSRQRNAGT